MLETITLESAIKFSTPYAKKIFNEKIKPLVTNKINEYFKNKADINKFERESIKYISRIAGQCTTMNTIAFPNTPKKLEDLYIPLNLIDENKLKTTVDDHIDIFKNVNKVLINDTAGMGKSTISKKILKNIITKNEFIPIYIELRHLTKDPIGHQILLLLGIKSENPEKILNNLPLVYLFDGLDEIQSDAKQHIINEIRKFIDQIDKPKILITSRLESYLAEFYDFTRFTIEPLSESCAYKLIKKYDPNGEVAKKLIEGIKQSDDRGLKDFLSTPLYVSLLFCAYRYKTVIPQKKHLFYSQVYDALFESHDLSKEVGFVRPKHSNLDSSEFHLILRRLGFWYLKNGGKIEFQKDELEITILDILAHVSGIKTNAVKFVKDLTETVPLFIKEGSNIRWSHKSLMEYFSAMFICHDTKEKQKTILLHFFNSTNWSSFKNIFELSADIDFEAFGSSIVKETLENFIEYNNTSYKDITNNRIKKSSIEIRISATFHKSFGFRIINEKDFSFDDVSFLSISHPDTDELKKTLNQNNNQFSFIISGLGTGTLVRGVYALNKQNMIINILQTKCPHLLMKIDEDFNERKKITALKENKNYIVTDKRNNLINNSKYFDSINQWLKDDEFIGLNLNESINELEKITSETNNGIDKLIGDLI